MCYLDALNEVIKLNDEDILANQSPLDYIAAVRDIYLPLMSGAETVMVPKNEFAMGGRLFDVLNKYDKYLFDVSSLCHASPPCRNKKTCSSARSSYKNPQYPDIWRLEHIQLN